MLSNVLLYLGQDVNIHLVREVARFCKKIQAKCTILNVFEEPAEPFLSYFEDKKINTRQIIADHVEELLMSEAEFFSECQRKILWGVGFIEAIKYVESQGFDLLVADAQGDIAQRHSESMHLMRKCPCPVFLYKNNFFKGAVRILAAINSADISPVGQKLNKSILEHGLTLRKFFKGHLHVITCWSGYMESILSSPKFSDQEVSQYLAIAQDKSTQGLNNLLSAMDIEQLVTKKVVHGKPYPIIAHYVQQKNIDVVVMGSIARAGIQGFFVGNTAEKLSTGIGCSMLTIKPEGFQTPVR